MRWLTRCYCLRHNSKWWHNVSFILTTPTFCRGQTSANYPALSVCCNLSSAGLLRVEVDQGKNQTLCRDSNLKSRSLLSLVHSKVTDDCHILLLGDSVWLMSQCLYRGKWLIPSPRASSTILMCKGLTKHYLVLYREGGFITGGPVSMHTRFRMPSHSKIKE